MYQRAQPVGGHLDQGSSHFNSTPTHLHTHTQEFSLEYSLEYSQEWSQEYSCTFPVYVAYLLTAHFCRPGPGYLVDYSGQSCQGGGDCPWNGKGHRMGTRGLPLYEQNDSVVIVPGRGLQCPDYYEL